MKNNPVHIQCHFKGFYFEKKERPSYTQTLKTIRTHVKKWNGKITRNTGLAGCGTWIDIKFNTIGNACKFLKFFNTAYCDEYRNAKAMLY